MFVSVIIVVLVDMHKQEPVLLVSAYNDIAFTWWNRLTFWHQVVTNWTSGSRVYCVLCLIAHVMSWCGEFVWNIRAFLCLHI